MNSADALLQAAKRCAALTAGDQGFSKHVGRTAAMLRRQLEPHITEADQPDLLFPVGVKQNEKWFPGAVLTFPDRAVVAWVTTSFRQTTGDLVLSYKNVTRVVDGPVDPATRKGPEMTWLSIEGNVPVTMRVPHPPGVNLPTMLSGILQGSVTFSYKDASTGTEAKTEPSAYTPVNAPRSADETPAQRRSESTLRLGPPTRCARCGAIGQSSDDDARCRECGHLAEPEPLGPNAPDGWHPDPLNPNRMRYWWQGAWTGLPRDITPQDPSSNPPEPAALREPTPTADSSRRGAAGQSSDDDEPEPLGPNAPDGWHPDPLNPNRQRYWWQGKWTGLPRDITPENPQPTEPTPAGQHEPMQTIAESGAATNDRGVSRMNQEAFAEELHRMVQSNGSVVSLNGALQAMSGDIAAGADFINIIASTSSSHKHQYLLVNTRSVLAMKFGTFGTKTLWSVLVADIRSVAPRIGVINNQFNIAELVLDTSSGERKFTFGMSHAHYPHVAEIAEANLNVAVHEITLAMNRETPAPPKPAPRPEALAPRPEIDESALPALPAVLRNLAPAANKHRLGDPFGPGWGLEPTMDVLHNLLRSADDCRSCGHFVATDLRSYLGDPDAHLTLDDLLAIMGANEASFREHGIDAVRALGGGAHNLLLEFGDSGSMWDLWLSRDDVAVEMCAWFIVARLRMTTAGVLPELRATNNTVPSAAVKHGTVKTWSEAKGVGFISPDDGSENVLARFEDLERPLSALQVGAQVQYEEAMGPKGPKAINVSLRA